VSALSKDIHLLCMLHASHAAGCPPAVQQAGFADRTFWIATAQHRYELAGFSGYGYADAERSHRAEESGFMVIRLHRPFTAASVAAVF
jgi:hypothetical protein